MRSFRSRLACFALTLCATVACRAVEPEPERPLQTELEAATRASDPAVRRAAVRILGERGSASSLEPLGALLVDPDRGVQLAAIGALGGLGTRAADQRARVAELLASAVRGGSHDIRYFALNALGKCGPAAARQLDTIRACFEDEPTDIQIAAAIVLGEVGATAELEQRAVELIRQNSGGPWDYALAQLLPFLHERTSAAALEKLLASDDATVRFRVECTRARLEGTDSVRRGEGELEQNWETENRKATEALHREDWKRVPRETLWALAARARLVLSGEMHESEGPIRENQRELLRAFTRQPALEAVGYEPSVEEAQSGVLELARSLGLRTIPLETNWKQLGDEGRPGAREWEALAAISAFLLENPRHRMLVLRGESHVLPGGFLVGRLPVEPLVVLCGCVVNVPLTACGLRCNGSAFEIGSSGRVFTLPYDEPSTARDFAVLERWLAQPAPRSP